MEQVGERLDEILKKEQWKGPLEMGTCGAMDKWLSFPPWSVAATILASGLVGLALTLVPHGDIQAPSPVMVAFCSG